MTASPPSHFNYHLAFEPGQPSATPFRRCNGPL
jgi:hypothetical protein